MQLRIMPALAQHYSLRTPRVSVLLPAVSLASTVRSLTVLLTILPLATVPYDAEGVYSRKDRKVNK